MALGDIDTEALIAEAEIGESARVFLAGDLGRMLVGMAQQEIDGALAGLADVEPTDTKTIRDLQNKIWLGRHFGQWLGELVSKGNNAISIYKQQQET